jgi:hypothetical protein
MSILNFGNFNSVAFIGSFPLLAVIFRCWADSMRLLLIESARASLLSALALIGAAGAGQPSERVTSGTH